MYLHFPKGRFRLILKSEITVCAHLIHVSPPHTSHLETHVEITKAWQHSELGYGTTWASWSRELHSDGESSGTETNQGTRYKEIFVRKRKQHITRVVYITTQLGSHCVSNLVRVREITHNTHSGNDLCDFCADTELPPKRHRFVLALDTTLMGF